MQRPLRSPSACAIVAGASVLVAAVLYGAAPVAGAPSSAGTAFQIERVSAPDTKTIEITFSERVDPELLRLAAGNRNYLANYVRVSGGTAGGSDAALDGRPLSRLPGTAVWPVDTPAQNTVRIVLGSQAGGPALADAAYKLWLDGFGDRFEDLYLKSADGDALAGTTTPEVAFEGNTETAELASIAEARATDSRTVALTFGQSVLNGMPSGRYTAANIRLVGPTATTNAVYVQHRAATDGRQYELSFGTDLDPSVTYRLEITGAHRLATTGGLVAQTAVLQHDLQGSGIGSPQPAIAGLEVNQNRDELTVRLNRKLSAVTPYGVSVPVAETPRGVGGTSLTAAQLRGILTISGRLARKPGRGQVGDAVRLEDVAAYLPDARTIVVNLEDGQHLERRSRVSTSLRANALVDLAGKANAAAGQPVGAWVPNSRVTPPTNYDPRARDYLRVDKHTTVDFRHNAFTFLNPPVDYSVPQANVRDKLVNETIDTITVDNKYIKATFVPGYGARLLSLIYKPTGHDLLYTNPTGTPYGHTNPPPAPSTSPFYHSWLMVWGGIFPTTTEAEHGKYWFLPWDYSVSETRDSVSITMWKDDTLDYQYKPARFRYGATGIRTTVIYTVSRTSPTVDMEVKLENPTAQAREYEYWTCTTLAPGEVSTDGSPTMEVISPVKVIQRDPAYTWMAQQEQPANPETPNDRFLKLDKLKKMTNWTNNGIAYGQGLATLPQANWWGVVNHENGEGVVRVGDNTITPGMKFWEWGHNASFDTNIFSKGSSARPYIELWAGTSPRFFTPDVLPAGGSKSWKETYLPTMDLANVTNANENGAAYVAFSGTGSQRTVTGDVFTTHIGERMHALLVNDRGRVLAAERFTGEASGSMRLTGKAAAGDTVRLVLTDDRNRVLLTAEAAAA